jgi:dTDP-4-dehydrorhamnose reductase
MRVLLFGHRGYIGSEFVNQLSRIHEIHLTTAPSRKPDGNHYTFFELLAVIEQHGPDVIINCAAYIGKNSVVDCEDNKDQTILSNVIFPRMLGEICKDRGIILGHMSSGCVFNGYTMGGYEEDDNVGLSFRTKCSFYTGTKVMAEDALVDVTEKYIWRIRLPFDCFNHHRNYLTKLMNFDRLIVAENSLSNRIESVSACIQCLLNKVPFGTYHVTNPGGIRTDEIAVLIRKYIDKNKDFQYFSSTQELDKLTNIVRSNTVLNSQKLANVGIYMSPIHDSVEISLKTWVD